MSIFTKLFLCIFVTFAHAETVPCSSDDRTVVILKARGRVGNHIWALMKQILFELEAGVEFHLTEDTRWILNEYFKGYDENEYIR